MSDDEEVELAEESEDSEDDVEETEEGLPSATDVVHMVRGTV